MLLHNLREKTLDYSLDLRSSRASARREMTMAATWQIDEWKNGRAVLARELELLVSRKIVAGDKVSIKHLKAKIAAVDAMIKGRSP